MVTLFVIVLFKNNLLLPPSLEVETGSGLTFEYFIMDCF